MGYVFLPPALILFMVVVAYPVFNTLKQAFIRFVFKILPMGGKWVGLANYKQLIQDPNTWVTFRVHPAFYGGFGYFGNCHRMGCALIMNIGMRGEGIVRGWYFCVISVI